MGPKQEETGGREPDAGLEEGKGQENPQHLLLRGYFLWILTVPGSQQVWEGGWALWRYEVAAVSGGESQTLGVCS